MTKRLVAMLLSISMLACLFAGCGGNASSTAASEKSSQPVEEASQKAPEPEAETPGCSRNGAGICR